MSETATYPAWIHEAEGVYGVEDEGFYGEYWRGHHDLDEVRRYVLAEHEVEPITVGHEWWRKVPIRGDFSGFRLWRAAPGSPGAFPVTFWDREKWDRGGVPETTEVDDA